MEAMNASISNFAAALPGNPEPGTAEVEGFSSRVDEICQKVDKVRWIDVDAIELETNITSVDSERGLEEFS